MKNIGDSVIALSDGYSREPYSEGDKGKISYMSDETGWFKVLLDDGTQLGMVFPWQWEKYTKEN